MLNVLHHLPQVVFFLQELKVLQPQVQQPSALALEVPAGAKRCDWVAMCVCQRCDDFAVRMSKTFKNTIYANPPLGHHILLMNITNIIFGYIIAKGNHKNHKNQ